MATEHPRSQAVVHWLLAEPDPEDCLLLFFVALPRVLGVESGLSTNVFLHETAMLDRNLWHGQRPPAVEAVVAKLYRNGDALAGYN